MFPDIGRMVKVRWFWFNRDRRRARWNKYRLFCLFPKWLSPFYHFQLIPLSFCLSCLTASSHSTPLALLSWKIPYGIWIKPRTSWSDPIADPASRGGGTRDLLIPSNLNYRVILWGHHAFLHYINSLHSNRWFYWSIFVPSCFALLHCHNFTSTVQDSFRQKRQPSIHPIKQ